MQAKKAWFPVPLSAFKGKVSRALKSQPPIIALYKQSVFLPAYMQFHTVPAFYFKGDIVAGTAAVG